MPRFEIKYYAVLREKAGRRAETLETIATTPAADYEKLRARNGFKRDRDPVRAAVNNECAGAESATSAGDDAAGDAAEHFAFDTTPAMAGHHDDRVLNLGGDIEDDHSGITVLDERPRPFADRPGDTVQVALARRGLLVARNRGDDDDRGIIATRNHPRAVDRSRGDPVEINLRIA